MSVTPSVVAVREATGADGTAIQATVDLFRADLGDPLNGSTAGTQPAGRRDINWDGVPDADATPGRFPGNFFNAVAPRGAILSFADDARATFAVSADASNPATTPVEFANFNATYSTAFGTFSAERLFTPVGNNAYDVTFYVPGSLTRATVSGFGAVFTDVDVAGSSKIEFFDSGGNLAYSREVLATAGDASLSFLGVKFVGSPIARVRVTSGDTAITAAASPNDITQGGTGDVVVVDDFIYGEPQADSARIAVASGGKGAPQVRVLNASTGAEVINFLAYDVGFKGGVRVATGDVNGDGVWDVVTAPGKGQAALIRVFSGVDWSQLSEFTAFDTAFKGGAHVAVGNIDGDAFADIIVSRDKGAPKNNDRQVRVFSGEDKVVLGEFNIFAANAKGGFTVAAGDFNGDYVDDVVIGQALGSSQVRVVDGTLLTSVDANGTIAAGAVLGQVDAFGGGIKNGAYLAAADVTGDGVIDLVVGGVGTNSQSRVRTFTFDGSTFAQQRELFAFNSTFNGGVRVAAGDVNGDGVADIVIGAGPGGGPHVRNAGVRVSDLDSFLAFDSGFKGGVFVGLLD